jgi:hypothetical protein
MISRVRRSTSQGSGCKQGGEQHPVSGGEPYFLTAQLPFEDRDLMA